MLKELEGFRGTIYKDQIGVDTIGMCPQLTTPASQSLTILRIWP
jgi:GH24 family phage-related lysozyme (muramidase)